MAHGVISDTHIYSYNRHLILKGKTKYQRRLERGKKKKKRKIAIGKYFFIALSNFLKENIKNKPQIQLDPDNTNPRTSQTFPHPRAKCFLELFYLPISKKGANKPIFRCQ